MSIEREPGCLVLVGTPIGNLGDVTPRAIEALRGADIVAAEDTRRTRKLLSAFDIHPPRMISIRAENEANRIEDVDRWLREGRRVALVSDAGMPLLSDPGDRLVRAILETGGAVHVVPGPDAATAALAVSGLPANRWCFEGFLPRRGSARAARLRSLATEPRTAVVYEAPHRMHRTLDDLVESLREGRSVAVANDLTKLHETVWRGTLREVRDAFRDITPKGEFVIVLAGELVVAAQPGRR